MVKESHYLMDALKRGKPAYNLQKGLLHRNPQKKKCGHLVSGEGGRKFAVLPKRKKRRGKKEGTVFLLRD